MFVDAQRPRCPVEADLQETGTSYEEQAVRALRR